MDHSNKRKEGMAVSKENNGLFSGALNLEKF
jgi:hypothetical protein